MNNTLLTIPSEDDASRMGLRLLTGEAAMAPLCVHTGRTFPMAPEALVAKAFANEPLSSLPRWQVTDQETATTSSGALVSEVKAKIMDGQFLQLADLGVSFNEDEQTNTSKVEAGISQDPSLTEHLRRVNSDFQSLQRIISHMDFIVAKKRLAEQHLTAFFSIVNTFTSMPASKGRSRLFAVAAEQCSFNRKHYIFEMPVVVPTSHLVDIVSAMPVCFLSGRGVAPSNDSDPLVSSAAQFLCDQVGSQAFAWFYQIYNRRDRKIKDFPEIDPMPHDYAEFRTLLEPKVDLEVIATPYHHIASHEWADPSWAASIDPIALGLFTDVPFAIVFKRWSGTGIFPMFAHLIARTMQHLSVNRGKLQGFGDTPYWHKGDSITSEAIFLKNASGVLPQFAGKVVQKFNDGQLLTFLREGAAM